MKVSATPLTPELLNMLHDSAQSVVMTVIAVEAVDSICHCVNADQCLGEALSGLDRLLGARRA